MTNLSLEQGLRTRMWVIGIPPTYRHEFVTMVLRWHRCSGVEWTVKRLKSLKVDLYRRRAGLLPLTWVRKNRKGDLGGCIGGLFRYADKSETNFRKVIQALMIFSVFKHTKPSDSQVKKFTTALRAAPPSIEGMQKFYTSARRIFGGQTVDRREDVSLIFYRGSSSKRKPSKAMRSVAQDSFVLDDAELLMQSSWGVDLVHNFQGLFGPVFRGLNLHPIVPPYYGSHITNVDPYQTIGGKIAFLQEPGLKLRSVASPHLAYQLALRHFGSAVYALARTLPWDCTHDQSKPVQTLQDHLRKGSTVHSVDLSSATDYFPLEVQCDLMKALFGNIDDIALFEHLSKSTWISPIGAVRWNRGQPLGLYPSFAVFTVTHGLLLWYLNGCSWNKDFFVVGDDVVILNDRLHQKYLQILDEWGCPYSPEKSISSNQISEFAGKVFTSNMVIPQYKWNEMSNDNFLDIARQLGHRSRILLTKRQRAVFDIVKNCTEPLGLNFSYPGSDLASMEALTLKTFGPENEKVLESLMDQSSIVWKNLLGSHSNPSSRLVKPTSVDTDFVLNHLSTFDEKVRKVLREILPWFLLQDPRLFSGVPEAVGITDLPPAILQPSRVTTLDRYERILNQ